MMRLGHVKKAAVMVFVGITVSKLFTYLFRLIISRLGPDAYGVFSLALAIYGFALIFAIMGLQSGVERYIPFYRAHKDPKKEKGAFRTAIISVTISSIVLALLLFFFSEYLAKIFHNEAIAPVLRIFSLGLPFAALGTVTVSSLKAYQAVKKAVVAQYYVEGFSRIVIVAVLIAFGFGLFGAVVGFILASIIMFLVAGFFIRKFIKKKDKYILLFKELLPYSLPLMFSSFLYFIIYYTDSLMIGFYQDVNQVGIYNVSLPTAGLLFIIPESIFVLFVPLMTLYVVKKKKKEFQRLFYKSFWFSFFLNLPIALVLIFLPHLVIAMLFGKAYVAGSLALSILAIGYFFRLTFLPYTKLLEVLKKQHSILAITLIACVMNVVLNILLIPSYSIIGGALATSLTYVFIGMSNFFLARRYTKEFIQA